MTDYNDGEWHAWINEESPVHPESEVEVFGLPRAGGPFHDNGKAKHIAWERVKVFRVTKAHREPREFWLFLDGFDYVYRSLEDAECDRQPGEEIIHVREVLE